MFDLHTLLVLIPLLPLAGSAATAFLGPGLLRGKSHWPCLVGVMGSCVLAFLVLYQVANSSGPEPVQFYYTWFQTGGLDIGFTLQVDYLTAVMLVTVTFVSSLIAVFSVGYMHGDPGYPRFFAEIALFVFSMTGLVLAANFLLLYAFWEGVGLCSYLLIGFWFAKPSAAEAARKAFLVTRLGDMGFFIGLLVLWTHFGGSLEFASVFANAPKVDPVWVQAACLLLLCGAVGKSAQFPLHVWLPDAMEGPTPVSALIHAATMVTAGVYLVARCSPLFELAPAAQLVVASIGGFTALLAALIALTQNDLKRVLAYSTISQLGYMFLALGSGLITQDGSRALLLAAVVAAIFHLFTHAFFKALLFLSAGSLMHAMGGVIDMRRFSGLRYALPTTHWTFLCGALSLAALPPFSGFWSKDEILGVAFRAAQEPGNAASMIYALLFCAGVLTAGLTAFYTFRAYFLTFWGELKVPHEAGHHAHESPPVMLWPLRILSVGAVAFGFVFGPLPEWLDMPFGIADFLGRNTWLQNPPGGAVTEHGVNVVLMIGSTAFVVAGIALAAAMYLQWPGSATKLASQINMLYQVSLNKFGFDELYYALVVRPMEILAEVCRWVDSWIVDGLVDLVGHVPAYAGQLLRPIQNGLLQFYALAMALGVAVFLLAMAWRFAL
jgi:NADH-quinone oxidoreductase subunit L